MGEGLARKQMAHKITTQTFAQVYDDSLAAEDMGALSGEGADARAMEKIESLRSLLVTHVPRTSALRSFANVPVGDPIRVAQKVNADKTATRKNVQCLRVCMI